MSTEGNGGDSSTKIVLIIVGVVGGILVLCVLGCVGIFYLATRAIQQVGSSAMQMVTDMQASQIVAENFLSDIAQGQADVAYSETTQAFQKRQTLDQFRALIDKNSLLKKHSSSFVFAQNASPNLVIYQGTVSGPEGQLTCTIHVAKEGEVWKVDRFTIP